MNLSWYFRAGLNDPGHLGSMTFIDTENRVLYVVRFGVSGTIVDVTW